MWQDLHEKYSDKVQIIGVAVDAQGPDKPRFYTDKASVTFPMFIDSQNLLGEFFGFKALPNGLLVETGGVIIYSKFGGFEIREPERRKNIEGWIVSGKNIENESLVADLLPAAALELFHQGLNALNRKNVNLTSELWRRAVELDPKNLVVRKQLWALENPDRFYLGTVDLDWQKDLLERGL